MGYRSDVTSAVFFADHSHQIESVVKYQAHCVHDKHQSVLDVDAHLDVTPDKVTLCDHPGYSLEVQSWKWYRGYDDIDAWEHFLSFMHRECDASTIFIRLGEDSNDNEFEVNESSIEKLRDLDLWQHYGIERSIFSPTFSKA